MSAFFIQINRFKANRIRSNLQPVAAGCAARRHFTASAAVLKSLNDKFSYLL